MVGRRRLQPLSDHDALSDNATTYCLSTDAADRLRYVSFISCHCSVRFAMGSGRLTCHWLRTTPSVVTEYTGSGVDFGKKNTVRLYVFPEQ